MTTATTKTPAATVMSLYDAFGRGDVPFILSLLADDVQFDADWTDSYAHRAGVVHLGPRRGVSQVAAFFASIASWKVEEFSVLDVMSSERQVTAQVKAAFVLPNGNRLMDDELHLWTFNGAGKISRLRHYVDTAKHIALSGD